MITYYAQLLIISNDQVQQAALNDVLSQLNLYAATFTNTLAQADGLLAVNKYDLILLDVDLAGQIGRLTNLLDEDGVKLPLLLMTTERRLDRLTELVTSGSVADYIALPTSAALFKARLQPHVQRRFLEQQALTALGAFNEIEKIADDLRLDILPLGIALSKEKDFDRLLERIVTKAMAICNADIGALYLRDQDRLRIAITRINSLNLAYGGTTQNPIPYRDVILYDESGDPNLEMVAAYVALEGVTINVSDIYGDSGFDFERILQFDQQHNYRSVSCLTVPLHNDKEVIGVLQLLNAQNEETGAVQSFGAYQQLVAESLASQAAIALHNRSLSRQREALLRYKRELEIGREIQAGFFPSHLPQPPGWELEARFWPAREVAGDFYDAFSLPYGKLALVIADVCDKGVVAALFMALIRSLLRAYVQQHYYMRSHYTPAGRQREAAGKWPFLSDDATALLDAIRLTNAYIGSAHGDTHMFATLFFGILEPSSGELIYANCGHNPPLVVGNGDVKAQLMPTGPAVGLQPEAHYTAAAYRLAAGDILLGFTDGVTEARAADGQLFGKQRLAALLRDYSGTAGDLLEQIEATIRDFSATAELYDDLALLALRRLSSG